ncbi:MAG: TonB family protein [Hahellaceae bacterium]|nr:TonB family protein [Hahellaceae bacterium]
MFLNPRPRQMRSSARPTLEGLSRKLTLTLWLMPAATFIQTVQAEMLNGVARYEQLSREYYSVAFYTQDPVTDVETALAAATPMRAELRIVVKEWTPFSFGQIWMRDLSMNNELSEKAEQIKPLMTFTHFPKAPLMKGDRIDIFYAPASGTRIRFNGEDVTQAEGATLFRYVLKTWIGSSPPTRQFRDDLLAGGVTGKATLEKELGRHNELKIATGREGLLKGWQAEANLAAKEAEKARLEEAKAAEEAARKKAEEEAKQLAAQKEVEEKAAKAAAARAAAEAQAVEAEKSLALAREEAKQLAEKAAQAAERAKTEAVAEAAKVAEAEQRAAEAALKRQAEEETKARVAAEAAAAEVAAQAKADADVKALKSQRLGKQEAEYQASLYRWKIQDAVSRKVSYPDWARLFGEKGTYKASLKLNAQGQVTAITRLEPDGSSPLAEALKEAINKAAPFGPLPSGLDTSTVFTVQHQFSSGDSAAPATAKPAMPAALLEKRKASLTDADRAAMVKEYTQSVRAKINQSVVYPLWAKRQKKTGEVSAKVTLGAKGEVISVDLTQEASLKLFNTALVDGVRSGAPYDPIPEVLGMSRIEIPLTYQFEL